MADIDSDGDGLADKEEIVLGTNPLSQDTDGDGLNDGAEMTVGTLPLVPDTDAGALTYSEELDFRFNPLLIDSNADGCDDLSQHLDICPASCPNDLTGDGMVNVQDILIMLGAFGSICP